MMKQVNKNDENKSDAKGTLMTKKRKKKGRNKKQKKKFILIFFLRFFQEQNLIRNGQRFR